MKKTLFLFMMGLFISQSALAGNVTCVVTDDQNGDEQVIKETIEVSAKTHWFKDFKVKALPNNKLTISLDFDSEDGGLYYLSLIDATRKVTAQTVARAPKNMYVFLGMEKLGIYASCSEK